MSKRFVIFCIAVLALALAMPAYAEVQNVKVSGDLDIKAVNRYNFALGMSDANSGGNQDAFLSITRLRVDAELTDNVSVVIRLLNERDWDVETSGGNASDGNTDMDLDLSYVVLKEFLYSPLTLTAGRQELHFGNDLIVGDVDGNSASVGNFGGGATLTDYADLSVRKAFDAVRGTLDYIFADQPLVVDLVYSKIDENTSNVEDDITLMGANANYVVNDDLLSEAYFWLRERKPGAVGTAAANDGNVVQGVEGSRLYTLGTRSVYTGVDNLTVQAEGAYQFGKRIWSADINANRGFNTSRLLNSRLSVNAWALQVIASYILEDVRHDPTLGVSYTHLSGEKYDESKGYQAWDSMFENQGGGTIWNKILGFSNCDLYNVSVSAKPDFVDDLTVKANWYHIRLVESLVGSSREDGYFISGLPTGQGYSVTNDVYLGDEIDLDFIYDYTEDVQLGLSLGWFVPGDTFHVNNNDTATQAIASMKVTF